MDKTFGIEKYNGLLSGESYLRKINQFPLLTPEEEFMRKEISPRPRTEGLAGGMEHAYL